MSEARNGVKMPGRVYKRVCDPIQDRLPSDEGLTLETSAFESVYGGQFTLSSQLINPIILLYLPPAQHHSFFRNIPLYNNYTTI